MNALHFDLTRGESDTESVRIVLAEGYPEDHAEEDDVMSERGLEGHSSDDEEEELPVILKMSGFYPIQNFGQFLADPHFFSR